MKSKITQQKNEYETQAENFLKQTGTAFSCEFLKWDNYFNDDDQPRDVYTITLKRGDREFKFTFGQSINNSIPFIAWTPEGKKALRNNKDVARHRAKGQHVEKNKNFKEPTAYDVLACLQKYDPENFKFFCDEYGYDNDSIKAHKIYEAVVNEWQNIKILYNDEEIELLREIN